MYVKPTENQINKAINGGWPREEAERGYTIVDYDGIGLLQIVAIGDVYLSADDCEGYDDEACAYEAERSGYCKIIPIDELPENFEVNGYSARWFGWVDTPENRKAIEEYCKGIRKWQSMRNVVKTSNGKYVLVDTAFIDWDGPERWETIAIRCNSHGEPLAHAWGKPLKIEAAYTSAEAKAKHEATVKELSNTAVPF